MNCLYLSGTVSAGHISRGGTLQSVEPLHHVCMIMQVVGAHRSLQSRAHMWYPVVTRCLQVTLAEVISQPFCVLVALCV